jgi:hypothetical protein
MVHTAKYVKLVKTTTTATATIIMATACNYEDKGDWREWMAQHG